MKAHPVYGQGGAYWGMNFDCPGCEIGHHVVLTDWTPPGKTRAPDDGRPKWVFNGDPAKPTFSPSILVHTHWGPERRSVVCHSFVRDGRIEFLPDCTHALAGQTVDLPDVDP
jgi:hypothetical protein